ncbi:hypothetical protein T07_12565 [Trichinella nelsoni]|uniref:Uncharacterized protein n=1 Tax=Trichinella nelsoni TaxID=6336 RepID=A0A0V0RIK1_9BILA|nr:hypothetical protein T07_12565 [Trichinella nelsoni]
MLNNKHANFYLQFDSKHINSHYSHLQINNQQYSTLNTVYENIPNSITIHFFTGILSSDNYRIHWQQLKIEIDNVI